MNQDIYPYAFHRDAEHTGDELAAIHDLINVCIDSLKLVNACESSSTVAVLEMARERAFDALEPTRKLQAELHKQWLADIKSQEKSGVNA